MYDLTGLRIPVGASEGVVGWVHRWCRLLNSDDGGKTAVKELERRKKERSPFKSPNLGPCTLDRVLLFPKGPPSFFPPSPPYHRPNA